MAQQSVGLARAREMMLTSTPPPAQRSQLKKKKKRRLDMEEQPEEAVELQGPAQLLETGAPLDPRALKHRRVMIPRQGFSQHEQRVRTARTWLTPSVLIHVC